ncbi:MAG TPA: hypothetical protein VG184_01170 [Acidimicrobiales bacterium]|nr:hypothetical protein [Acidimicrobiales bacterium]
MRLIVDPMNVVGARPDGWWRERDAAVRAGGEGRPGVALGHHPVKCRPST